VNTAASGLIEIESIPALRGTYGVLFYGTEVIMLTFPDADVYYPIPAYDWGNVDVASPPSIFPFQ